jgi:hypothetical protein
VHTILDSPNTSNEKTDMAAKTEDTALGHAIRGPTWATLATTCQQPIAAQQAEIGDIACLALMDDVSTIDKEIVAALRLWTEEADEERTKLGKLMLLLPKTVDDDDDAAFVPMATDRSDEEEREELSPPLPTFLLTWRKSDTDTAATTITTIISAMINNTLKATSAFHVSPEPEDEQGKHSPGTDEATNPVVQEEQTVPPYPTEHARR